MELGAPNRTYVESVSIASELKAVIYKPRSNIFNKEENILSSPETNYQKTKWKYIEILM